MKDLPDGWRSETVAALAAGGLFSDGDWVESKDQDPAGEVRLTQLADVGIGMFRDRSDRWMRDDQAASLRCTYLQPDDVLIARMPEPLGRACLVPAGPGLAVTAVDVAILRIKRTDLEPRYVMWALNAPRARSQMLAMQSGTTRKRISRKNLGLVKVPVPPLGEQRRIVKFLEDHFSRLHAAEGSITRSVKRLETLRLAVLLAVRETLVRNGASLRQLGDVCETSLGKMLDAKKAVGTPTPYLRNINVRWGRFDLSDVSAVPLTDAERERLALEAGDVLVCEGGEPGRCAVWTGRQGLMTYQKALHRLRVRDQGSLEPHFVAAMIEELIRAGRVDRMFTGTTIKHLPQEKLRALEIPVPPMAIQRQALEQLSTQGGELDRAQSQVARLASRMSVLRRALLQAAFSGRLTQRAFLGEAREEVTVV